jgi:hypothetical protein
MRYKNPRSGTTRVHITTTSTCAASAFGMVSVSIPSLSCAVTLAASTTSGSQSVREKVNELSGVGVVCVAGVGAVTSLDFAVVGVDDEAVSTEKVSDETCIGER